MQTDCTNQLNTLKEALLSSWVSMVKGVLFLLCSGTGIVYITEFGNIYVRIRLKSVWEMSESKVGDIIGLLFALIPILLVALVLRWVRIIRINSDLQIEQNREMIAILREIQEKK